MNSETAELLGATLRAAVEVEVSPTGLTPAGCPRIADRFAGSPVVREWISARSDRTPAVDGDRRIGATT